MCVDDQILSSYIDGELNEPWKTQIEEHLNWCKSCQERLEHIKSVHKLMADSTLEDEKIEESKDRVLKYINNNVINSKKHTFKQKVSDFMSKKFVIPLAAACVTFCFCLITFQPFKNPEFIPADVSVPTLSIDSVVPVRATDNHTTQDTLSKYSLDDILKYLDSQGYEIELRMKPISGIQVEEPEEGTTKLFLPNGSIFTFNPTKIFAVNNPTFTFSFT